MRVKIADKQAFVIKVENLIKQIEDQRAKYIAETKEFYAKKRSTFFGKLFYDASKEADDLFLDSAYCNNQYIQLQSLKNALQSSEIEEVWLEERQIGWFL